MKKFLAAMLIALLLIPTTIFADVATIEISGDNLAVGETKTITITFKGEKLGRVDADLTYDPSMLSYLGGGNNTGGDTGNVVLKLAGTGEDIVFHLQFKALKEGDSSISVQPRNLYNLDEESMGTSVEAKTVTITGTPAVQEPQVDSGANGETEKPKEDKDKKKENEKKETSFLGGYWLYGLIGGIALLIIIIAGILMAKKKAKRR